MMNIPLITHIKFLIFSLGIPYLIFNWLTIKYLGVTLHKALYLWFTNFQEVGIGYGVAVLFIFVILLLSLPVGGFINWIFSFVFSNPEKMMYVGSGELYSHYIALDESRRELTGPSFVNKFSFSPVFMAYQFYPDPSNVNWTGELVSSYTPSGFVHRLLMFVSMLLMMLCIYCLFALKLENFLNGAQIAFDNQKGILSLFDDIGIDIKMLAVITFFSIPAFIIIPMFFPFGELKTERIYELKIKPGDDLKAKVVNIEVVTERQRIGLSEPAKYENVPTKIRDIYCQFNSLYSSPIYVATKIDIHDEIALMSVVESALVSGKDINVFVNDDMSFSILN